MRHGCIPSHKVWSVVCAADNRLLEKEVREHCNANVGPDPLYCPLPKGHIGFHRRSDDPTLVINKDNGQV